MQNGVFVLDPSALYTVIGVKENKNIDRFLNLYPNPATKFVRIMTNVNEEAELQVTNMLGQTVLKKSYLDFGTQNLDVSSLSNGTYFVGIKTKNNTLTRKLIINNN
jgi:hypothetical protein